MVQVQLHGFSVHVRYVLGHNRVLQCQHSLVPVLAQRLPHQNPAVREHHHNHERVVYS